MPEQIDKRDWVTRVLGVRFLGSAAEQVAAQPMPKLLPIWQTAKEQSDAGLQRLQEAMRNDDDEDLRFIAEHGVFGIGKVETVKLMAALMEADQNGTPQARTKLAKAVAAYQALLDVSPVVDLFEDNPLGVPVALRQTLGPALATIARHAAG